MKFLKRDHVGNWQIKYKYFLLGRIRDSPAPGWHYGGNLKRISIHYVNERKQKHYFLYIGKI